jgi:hypothetical protein
MSSNAVDEQLRKLINCIFDSHLDTIIDCETCSQQFVCLADLVASGIDTAQLLPAVQEHIDCCPDCFEEFHALVTVLSAENQGFIPNGSQG